MSCMCASDIAGHLDGVSVNAGRNEAASRATSGLFAGMGKERDVCTDNINLEGIGALLGRCGQAARPVDRRHEESWIREACPRRR